MSQQPPHAVIYRQTFHRIFLEIHEKKGTSTTIRGNANIMSLRHYCLLRLSCQRRIIPRCMHVLCTKEIIE